MIGLKRLFGFLFVGAGLCSTSGCGPGVACEDGALLVTTTADYTSYTLGFSDGTGASGVETAPLGSAESSAAFLGCNPVVIEHGTARLLFQSTHNPLKTRRTIDVDEPGVTDVYQTNPIELVSISEGKAYVLAGARNEIVIVDPRKSGAAGVLGTIDLSSFVDPGDLDGIVDQTAALRVGDRVYVGLARHYFDITFQAHFTSSLVIAIDSNTDALVDLDSTTDGVQGITTAGDNPTGMWHDAATDTLWVLSRGDSYVNDGGLESIDVATGTVHGYSITEGDLGGALMGFEAVSATRFLLVVDADPFADGTSEVVVYNPTTDIVDAAPLATGVDGIALSADTLYTWSRATGKGVRRYDALTGTDRDAGQPDLVFGDAPIYSLAVPK